MAYQYNSAEEQQDRRRRKQQEETTNSAARLEQAQHVLEAAAGILDASSWEQPLPTSSSASLSNQHQQQQQQQQQNPSRMTAAGSGGPRSNPIAIRRKEAKSDEFSSSDDEDEKDLDLKQLNLEDATSDAKRRAAQSLPSRYLLRAPHLGSVPTRNADELLPAISLSEQQDDTAGAASKHHQPEDGTVSYGSLRDSQMKGRFLDGPRSLYRDRRTGKLRQRSDSTRNVRFQMASSAPVPNAAGGAGADGLSIGERIQQSHKLQKAQNSTTTAGPGIAIASNISSGSEKQQTSSLSAMLEGASSSSSLIGGEPYNSSTAQSPMIGMPTNEALSNLNSTGGMGTSFAADDGGDDDDDDPSNMLSTSLTGLEILQRGLQKEPQKRSSVSRSSSSTAPQQQSVSLMSRSLSDTQPERRTTLQQSVFFPGAASTAASQLPIPTRNAGGSAAAAAAAAVDNSDPYAVGSLAPSNNGIAAFPPQQQFPSAAAAGQQQQLAPINSDDDALSDHNPDTEGAFDLDFE